RRSWRRSSTSAASSSTSASRCSCCTERSSDVSARPILKWPGGKAREWAQIEPFLPARIRNFVDPFMGGCAPFLRTRFEGRAYLNDKHERLVDLHARVQRGDAAFFSEVAALGDAWESLRAVADARRAAFVDLVARARGGEPARTEGDDDV